MRIAYYSALALLLTTQAYAQALPVVTVAPSGTDDTAAIQAAFSATSGGGRIELACGVFSIPTTQLTQALAAGKNLEVVGGGKNCTTLKFQTGAGIQISYGNQFSSTHWSDLALVTCTGDANSVGIKLVNAADNHNAALGANSSFSRVSWHGCDGYSGAQYWGKGVYIDNVSIINFDDIDYTGVHLPYRGIFAYLKGKSDYSNGVQYQFVNGTCTTYKNCIVFGPYLQGVVVANWNFQAGEAGVLVPYGQPVGVGNAQLNILNSQFGEHTIAGVYENSPVSPTLLSNNAFVITEPGSYGAIVSGSYSTVTGNTFTGIGTATTTGLSFLSQSGSSVAVATSNIFGGLGSAAWLQPGSQKITMKSNVCSGNTQNIVNQGTANTVEAC